MEQIGFLDAIALVFTDGAAALVALIERLASHG
jgi:hypothetical protein